MFLAFWAVRVSVTTAETLSESTRDDMYVNERPCSRTTGEPTVLRSGWPSIYRIHAGPQQLESPIQLKFMGLIQAQLCRECLFSQTAHCYHVTCEVHTQEPFQRDP